jgi:hypothetical protein
MPVLALDDTAREPRELGVARQHGGAARGVLERRVKSRSPPSGPRR